MAAGTVGFHFCVDTFTSQLESVPGDTADTLVSPYSTPALNVSFPRSPVRLLRAELALDWPEPRTIAGLCFPAGRGYGPSGQEPLFLLRLEALLRPRQAQPFRGVRPIWLPLWGTEQ